MPGERILIYIVSGKKKSDRQLSAWLEWFKLSRGMGDKPNDKNDKREILFTVLKDMQSQVFSDEVVKVFKKSKLQPPYDFKLENVCKMAVDRYDPEQILVSGYGNPESFTKWLTENEYPITVIKSQ